MPRTLLIVLLLFIPGAGFAQLADSCKVQNPDGGFASVRFVMREIISKKNADCYGVSQDQTPWVVEVNELLDQIGGGDVKKIRPRILATFKMIQAQLENESGPQFDQLKRALIKLVNHSPLTDETLVPVGLQADDWKYNTRRQSISIGDKESPVPLRPLLDDGCDNEPVDWNRCEPKVRSVERLLSYWGASSKTVWRYLQPFGQQTLVELELLEQRWDAYYYEAKSQNFIEVAFNSWRFNKNTEGEDGFLSPPDYQWIWLHPNIALEYIENAPAGSRFQESLVLEIFGRNDWTWKDGSAEMKRPFGWSIIAAVTDREAIEEVGLGIMFHFDHTYSVALTDHDGDAGLLVSVDLLQFYGELEKETRDKFQRYKNLHNELPDI